MEDARVVSIMLAFILHVSMYYVCFSFLNYLSDSKMPKDECLKVVA